MYICTLLVRIVTGFVREPTYSWKVLNSGKYTLMLTHAQIHELVLLKCLLKQQSNVPLFIHACTKFYCSIHYKGGGTLQLSEK